MYITARLFRRNSLCPSRKSFSTYILPQLTKSKTIEAYKYKVVYTLITITMYEKCLIAVFFLLTLQTLAFTLLRLTLIEGLEEVMHESHDFIRFLLMYLEVLRL